MLEPKKSPLGVLLPASQAGVLLPASHAGVRDPWFSEYGLGVLAELAAL
jgi:hypothetical protein